MCGIIGYIGPRPAGPILLEGLQRLEYRGYDSAGIAVVGEDGALALHKAPGKLSSLVTALGDAPPDGHIGIGHTRWATHGKPSEVNAHPQLDCHGRIVVIHNGIVENYRALKAELQAKGHAFRSETDTEVIPHLIESFLAEDVPLEEALRRTLHRLEGAHAIVVMDSAAPEHLVTARVGNAGGVVVGYGDGEMYIASDLPAVLPYTRRVVFLGDMEIARISSDGVTYVNAEGLALERAPQVLNLDPLSAAKGGYKHFLLKEIMEQPQAVLDTFQGRVMLDPLGVYLEDVSLAREQMVALRRVILVAMGTSLHAALVGKFLLEEIARVPAEVDSASEFRYRNPVIDADTLVIAITQSGETVDTLVAMEEARQHGAHVLTITNVPGSQASRIADSAIYTRAGLEVSVASTKTFVATLVALYLLGTALGQARGTVSDARLEELLVDVSKLPPLIGRVLERTEPVERIAHRYASLDDFLFLGRGINYPVALEGALKLKELSYIHAEGYPAGEMKHGPIALIDHNMPVVTIALQDAVYDKMLSNIEQVKARDGVVIAVATEGDEDLAQKVDHILYVPPVPPLLAPILAALPLQLLAYYIALRRGCDVDQPRNLAKTVTVE